MNRSVRDVMRPGVLSVPKSLTLAEVTRRLVEQDVHALFVSDDDGAVIGVISDIDLLAGEWLFTDEGSLSVMRSITAAELMSTPVSSVEISESLEGVAERMRREDIRRLLVTDHSQPVGVVSVSDIVRALGAQEVVRRTVREVMSSVIVTCRLETLLHAVARGMSERHSRSVVVVDAKGSPQGIITGSDLLEFAGEGKIEGVTAADVMHEPVTISPDDNLRVAANMMIRQHRHRLLVIDPGDPNAMPLGLISTSDIMHEMAQPGSAWQS
jgi:CBS domain-containing protein